MHDGHTRKISRKDDAGQKNDFLERHRALLVSISGATAGNEYPLERPQTTVGRGPGVDLAFDDAAMSQEHASLELLEDGFRIRDLGSTNGVVLNGSPTMAAELKHGDRIEMGKHCFQFVLEERPRVLKTHVLPE
ncbi:MAG: FHA domain-containing protein [Proteobacteria bacterium]|nr:FHA domain-containing protein [Pseudomonadota bacterium]